MKGLILILIGLPIFGLTQNQDKILVFRKSLLNFGNSNLKCVNITGEKYGFRYEYSIGCTSSKKYIRKSKKHNKKVDEILKKKNGKNWRSDYLDELTKCKIDEINSGYKKITDSIFQIGDKIITPKLYFTFEGGARIQDYCLDSLKMIANFIKNHPRFKIEIGIHSDIRGKPDYNKRITELRATRVKEALEYQLGKDNFDKISVKGFGETQPLFTEIEINNLIDEEMREEIHRINRRVEIKIIEIQ